MIFDEPNPLHRARRQRTAKASLSVLLTLLGIWIGSSFLPALIWAAIITIAIYPLYDKAEGRWPRHRGILLPGLATVLIALLVLAPLALGLIEAAREAKYLFTWLGGVRENGLPEPAWIASLPYAGEISSWWQQNLATPAGTAQQFHRFREGLLFRHSQLVGRDLLHRAIVFGFTLIALFFTLRDKSTIVRQLHRAGDKLLGADGERMGVQIVRSVRGTIDGLVLVGIGEGVAMTIAYVIAGVPHPLLLGMLTAVAAMIPFGAVVLFCIAAAMLLGAGSVAGAVAIVVWGTIVLFIADHFIRPVLIGGATKLPFVLVLIGILGGVETLGLLGLFVGPATMAALMLLWRDYIGEPAPPEDG